MYRARDALRGSEKRGVDASPGAAISRFIHHRGGLSPRTQSFDRWHRACLHRGQRTHAQIGIVVLLGTHAIDKKVDVLVLGTHGRTGIANFVLGSVAARVVETARVQC